MEVSQCDLVIVTCPYSDFAESKVRPAIVVSTAKINSSTNDCIVVPITSVLKDVPFSLNMTSSDISKGKLLFDSRVRIDKIYSVNKNLVRKKVGEVSPVYFEKIVTSLMAAFAYK